MYYTVKDVKEITGASQNKSYEIIRELQKSFYKKHPDAVFIQGRILKSYFDEVMGIERKNDSNENKKDFEIKTLG